MSTSVTVPSAAVVPPASDAAKPKTKVKKRNYRSYASQLRMILKDVVKTAPPTLDKEGKPENREAGFDVEALSALNLIVKDLTNRAANWQREGLTNMQSGGNAKKTLQPTEVVMSYRMLLPQSLWKRAFTYSDSAVKKFQQYRAEQAKLKPAAAPAAAGAAAPAAGKGRGKRKSTGAESRELKALGH